MLALQHVRERLKASVVPKDTAWFHLQVRPWWGRECGGAGDCFFHAVACALGRTMLEVRDMVACAVTPENVDALVAYYSDVDVVPAVAHAVRGQTTVEGRVRALRQLIQQPHIYEGDDTTMRLFVARCTDVGFLVLQRNPLVLERQVYMSRYTRRLVVLLHSGGHWQLAGRQIEDGGGGGGMQVLFDPLNLPPDLDQWVRDADVEYRRHFVNWHPRVELEQKKK